ncbi:hypothetical protein B0H10DRAFT_2235390 [Mycena sp. CBHHK59/15]|nr:hypothetical protein B0H10DRAFT_2235390 [Mycena sp. CBHHK59/15]
MRHLGEHLSTLVLHFDPSVDFPSIPIHFQPRYNTNLRAVHLMLDLTLFSLRQRLKNYRLAWTWMCLFLTAIPAALETLVIDISGDFDALLDLDWDRFAQALDAPQFSVLRTFRLQTPPHERAVEDVEAYVKEQIPNLYARGIVQITTAIATADEMGMDTIDVNRLAAFVASLAA